MGYIEIERAELMKIGFMACLRGVEEICMGDGVCLHRCLQHTKGINVFILKSKTFLGYFFRTKRKGGGCMVFFFRVLIHERFIAARPRARLASRQR